MTPSQSARSVRFPLLLGLATGAVIGWSMALLLPASHAASEPKAPDRRPVLEQTSEVFESAANQVFPAVIYLETRGEKVGNEIVARESGSAVLLQPKDFERPVLVTNLHVVAGVKLTDIDLYLADGRVIQPVRMWSDEQTDLAFLDPGIPGLTAARMGDSDRVRIGQWVLAIGSPFGLMQSVTHGIISAKQRRSLGISGSLRIKDFLQTDAPINPGNSGGPLVNLDGEVIGINTAIASHTGANSGVGFSIPINLIHWVMDELISGGRVRRAFLGVEFPFRFSYDDARKVGLASARGAAVESVQPGTPADRAGIRAGDVILEFDGAPIDDEYHLINRVSQSPVGKTVAIVIWRDRMRKPLQATLGSWDRPER